MPDNRKALLRYKILDKCLNDSYRKYFIEDLVAKCNEALMEIGLKPVSKRQIQSDIAFMKSTDGWSAPIISIQEGKRRYIRYSEDFSIMETPLTEMEIEQLETLITSLSRFQSIPMYDWVEELLSNLRYRFGVKNLEDNFIGFEQNRDLEGLRYLSDLINCIIRKQPISITYRPFGKDNLLWTIHPYYLKQYNNRWFLLGYNSAFDDISLLALDRIEAINDVNVPFIRNSKFDFEAYFRNIIGVTLEEGKKIEHIKLKFSVKRLPYVVSKPMHHSQFVEDERNGIVTLDLIPNKELVSEIIWYGNDVEVLTPVSLRNEIQQKIKGMYDIYFGVKDDCTTSR